VIENEHPGRDVDAEDVCVPGHVSDDAGRVAIGEDRLHAGAVAFAIGLIDRDRGGDVVTVQRRVEREPVRAVAVIVGRAVLHEERGRDAGDQRARPQRVLISARRLPRLAWIWLAERVVAVRVVVPGGPQMLHVLSG
jgi:hypothetical protein